MTTRIEKKQNTRAMYRLQRLDETMLVEEVKEWTSSNEFNYYLGYGGAGDALLLIASCWTDPKARIVFFENGGSLTRELFELFDLDVFLHHNILFSPLGKKVYEQVISRPTFQISAHLPDELDHKDWTNWQKYKERIVPAEPWRSLIGSFANPFPSRGVVCICPSGAHRDIKRQRYLTEFEYRKLVGKLLTQGYTVVTMDSPEHLWLYPKIGHKYSLRCTSTYLEHSDGKKEAIDTSRMLQILNGSDFCVTVETWPVIYCGLTGIPAKVIQTRWNGAYKGLTTTGDYIFMNPEIWTNAEFLTAEGTCY